MSTVEDLRAELELHAGQAPDGVGLVDAAVAGAIRVHRRRRVVATVAAAVAVAAVAVGLPIVRDLESAPPVDVPARTPSVLTTELAPGSGFVITGRLGTTGRQELHVMEERPTEQYPPTWTVQIYDPGWFDPGTLSAGWPVRVGDRDGLLVPALDKRVADDFYPSGLPPVYPSAEPSRPRSLPSGSFISAGPIPSLAWERAPDRWVTITGGGVDPAQTIALGAALRDVTPAPIEGPLQLSWLPAGLSVTYAESFATRYPAQEMLLTDADVKPAWLASQRPDPGPSVQGPAQEIRISVDGLGEASEYELKPLGKATDTVHGFPAWYSAGTVPGMTYSDAEARFFVKTDTCMISLHAGDRSLVTRADFVRMLMSARIGSCTTGEGWGPMVR